MKTKYNAIIKIGSIVKIFDNSEYRMRNATVIEISEDEALLYVTKFDKKHKTKLWYLELN